MTSLGSQFFRNRVQAGEILANQIAQDARLNDVDNAIVLALPRGGVPVAYPIAEKLGAPLDVFLVRKIGVEGQEELAMGAITETGTVFNHDLIYSLHISNESIQRVMAREKVELERRNKKYRKGKPPVDVRGRIVILVDDGIATGATMMVAIQSIKKMNPAKVIVAAPVGALDTLEKIKREVDQVVCPLKPPDLVGIGMWYLDFNQTEDAEVLKLLNKAEKMHPVPTLRGDSLK
ncbi:hypothetical protein G9A89_013784 [Geosiphon pyriformis]|nr:hypothetical protein G9A89_013784 [Geosiphon pyriformis]